MGLVLNARQEQFCQEYVQGGDATAAAIRADYSRWHAGMYGQVLLAMPRIRARIAELRGMPSQPSSDGPTIPLSALRELARAWGRAPAQEPDVGSLSTMEDLERLRQSMMAARTQPEPPRPRPAKAPAATANGPAAPGSTVDAKSHIKAFINRNRHGDDTEHRAHASGG